MSELSEFIQSPDVVELHMGYDENLISFLEDKEYIRMGKVASGNKAVIYVKEHKIDEVLRELGTKNLERLSLAMGLLGTQSINEVKIPDVKQELGLDLEGKGVLIGFIDTGIDYTHKAFINKDGSSKIKYIWDQTIKSEGPEGYHFGTEYNNAQINSAIRNSEST